MHITDWLGMGVMALAVTAMIIDLKWPAIKRWWDDVDD